MDNLSITFDPIFLSKLSSVYNCTGCGSFVLQQLGTIKTTEKNQIKYGLPTKFVGTTCTHCGHPYHMGGPIWADPIHCTEFVGQLLNEIPSSLGTFKRIEGILTMIKEELPDCPLYYTLDLLSGTLHLETPPMLAIRSAILNCGYRVSYTHMHKTSIKTDAPSEVLWDIMRTWESQHSINKKRLTENSPATKILSKKPEMFVSFEHHAEAKPESKKQNLLRFQQNPLPNWGPGMRARAMIGENKLSKRVRNQGKRKREFSEEEDMSK